MRWSFDRTQQELRHEKRAGECTQVSDKWALSVRFIHARTLARTGITDPCNVLPHLRIKLSPYRRQRNALSQYLFLVISGGQTTNTAARKPPSIHFTPVGMPPPSTGTGGRLIRRTTGNRRRLSLWQIWRTNGSRDHRSWSGEWIVKLRCWRGGTQKTALRKFHIRRAGEIGRWLSRTSRRSSTNSNNLRVQILMTRILYYRSIKSC